MNPVIQFASFGFHHHRYGGFGATHGGWLGHMVISAIVHAMIYSVIFRLMRQLSLGEALALVALVLIVLYAWGRQRSYRR